MKRLILAAALACVLSTATMAGEIPSTGLQSSGEIPSGGSSIAGEIPSTGASIAGEIPTSGAPVSDSTLMTAILAILGLVV